MPNHPTNQCTAHAASGARCQRYAIRGSNVCMVHGGAAPQVREKARQRLLEAADSVAAELVRVARDRKTPGPARVSAMNSILDRAGVEAVSRTEVTGLDGGPIEIGLREALRRGRDRARGAVPTALPEPDRP